MLDLLPVFQCLRFGLWILNPAGENANHRNWVMPCLPCQFAGRSATALRFGLGNRKLPTLGGLLYPLICRDVPGPSRQSLRSGTLVAMNFLNINMSLNYCDGRRGQNKKRMPQIMTIINVDNGYCLSGWLETLC